MRFFLCLVSLISFGGRARASPIVSLGTNISFDFAPDGRTYDRHASLFLRGGYRFEFLDAYLEISRYSIDQRVGYFSIDREHREWIFWGRYLWNEPWFVQPYLALGLGLQYDVVNTTFQGQQARDTGEPEALWSLAFGIRKGIWQGFSLDLESRVSASRTYAPNPLFGLGVLASYQF